MAIGDKHHPTPRQQSWARFPIYRANVYSTKHPQLQKPAFLVILVQVTREDGKYYGIIMHAASRYRNPRTKKDPFTSSFTINGEGYVGIWLPRPCLILGRSYYRQEFPMLHHAQSKEQWEP